MTERIAAKLSNIAVTHGIIDSDDYELYIYSYQTMIERLVSWGCILLLSCFFGTLPHTLVFIAFYGILRMFTGGWHASSFGVCFSVSIGLYTAFSLVAKMIADRVPSWIQLLLIIVSGLTILLLGPVAHPNKPMELKLLKKCYRTSIGVLLVELAATGVFYLIDAPLLLTFVLFSFAQMAVSLTIGHRLLKNQPCLTCKLVKR